MATRADYASRGHEPTASEVAAWRTFANLAATLALRKRSAWSELLGVAKASRSLRVFGHNTPNNPCILLIHLVLEATSSIDPDRYRDELGRLADLVLNLCDVADTFRQAARHVR